MKLMQKAYMGAAVVVVVVALSVVPARSVLAAPPDKDVTVVNTPAQPVPVVGTVNVDGGISGTVNAVQSGEWAVSIVPGRSLYYNPGFAVIGDGATVDHGPFDLRDLSKVRVILRAFNNNAGDIKFTVFVWHGATSAQTTVLDEDSLNEERVSRVYDAPPPSILVRVRNGVGNASNYHVVVIGR